MKKIITFLFIISASALLYCQSSIVYGAGTIIDIGTGAEVCAGSITINGTFTGSGTFCSGSLPFSETAADYFFPPLKVGNQITLFTPGGSGTLYWITRNTTYSIDGIDTIAGQIYYREVGTEYSIPPAVWTHRFQVFWIRKDSVGDVIIGAMSQQSTNIDSAMMVSGIIYSNAYLIDGYTNTFHFGGQTRVDSVLSVNDSESVPAGTFTNCLVVSETHFDTAGTVIYHELHYYASGIGMVKNIRTVPDSEAHTDELINYTTTAVRDTKNLIPSGLMLYQNYPNPFNPSTTINYNIPKSSFVTIKVYDVLGREVTTLVKEEKMPGSYSVTFDSGKLVSGVYFYQLRAGDYTSIKKMVLLK